MDSITGYDSASDNDETIPSSSSFSSSIPATSTTLEPTLQPTCAKPTMSCAPLVISSLATLSSASKDTSLTLFNATNTQVDIMMAPQVGPVNPFTGVVGNVPGYTKSGMGFIEATYVEDHSFNTSYQEYLRGERAANDGEKKEKGPKNKAKRPRLDYLEAIDDDDSAGPWAAETKITSTNMPKRLPKLPKDEDADGAKEEAEAPAIPGMFIVEPDEESEKWERVNERKLGSLLPPRPPRGSIARETDSVFHGSEERDYLGRSWTSAPPGVRAADNSLDQEAFIPKKCVKKFIGHTKGVQDIELLPGTGHLLVSGSMDGTCRVWDTMRDQGERRTYLGHSEAVRSISVANDGLQFLSSGYDRYVRLWDIESGKAVATFSNRKMNYQVKFNPVDKNAFICASSDNRLYGWDARTGEVTQEYNYHLQPCNTVTFIDNGRKFVSTSDDKKVLVWEFTIPVPITYIQEQEMHSIPAVTLHPTGNYFCGQSMDNSIVTYSCPEKVRQLKKKTYRGHVNSGYACQIAFSPNGQFMASGDGQGKLTFWDFKTGKIYRKLQAHDSGPCIGAVWHPLRPSWVFTCGWDGVIKLWD